MILHAVLDKYGTVRGLFPSKSDAEEFRQTWPRGRIVVREFEEVMYTGVEFCIRGLHEVLRVSAPPTFCTIAMVDYADERGLKMPWELWGGVKP